VFLKEAIERDSLSSVGSRFHARDAAVDAHCYRPLVLLFERLSRKQKSQLLDDRTNDREVMSEPGVSRFAIRSSYRTKTETGIEKKLSEPFSLHHRMPDSKRYL